MGQAGRAAVPAFTLGDGRHPLVIAAIEDR